jgi:hypothetical protein
MILANSLSCLVDCATSYNSTTNSFASLVTTQAGPMNTTACTTCTNYCFQCSTNSTCQEYIYTAKRYQSFTYNNFVLKASLNQLATFNFPSTPTSNSNLSF